MQFTRESSVVSNTSTQMCEDNPEDLCHLRGYLEPKDLTRRDRVEIVKGQQSLTIGSGTENNLVLAEPRISQYHCTITVEEDLNLGCIYLSLRDTSKNGVYIDGTKTARNTTRLIFAGSQLSFVQPELDVLGDFTFTFKIVASARSGGFAMSYDLLDSLGGMCSGVKRALKQATAAMYAVKIIQVDKIQPQKHKTPHQIAEKEVKIMQSLKHPNICKLHESFFEGTTLYLVMELLECGTLHDYVKETDHGLAETKARDVIHQICGGMAYMHDQGYTHRDLKPQNILLAKRLPLIVKICDFDKSQLLRDHHSTLVGTMYYIAPEVSRQNRGKKVKGYKHSVDSYSVGCITYFVLTLNLPFIQKGSQPRTLTHHIQSRKLDLTALATKPGGVSPEATTFISRLVQMKPRNRLTMRAALNHKWFANYEAPQTFSAEEYDEEYGPDTFLSPRKNRLPLASIAEEADPMGDCHPISATDWDADIVMGSAEPKRTPAVTNSLRRSTRSNKGKYPNLHRKRFLC